MGVEGKQQQLGDREGDVGEKQQQMGDREREVGERVRERATRITFRLREHRHPWHRVVSYLCVYWVPKQK